MKKTYFYFLFLFFLLLSPFLVFSQSNQYLHFDMEDDYVYLDGASQYIAGDQMSMSGWFYCDELDYGQGMMGFRASDNGFYLIQLGDGKVECRIHTTGNSLPFTFESGVNSTIPQTWQYWTWVYDGSEAILYINGFYQGSISASGLITNSNIAFTIGRSILGTLDFYYGGRVDEVSVWNIALEQDEIFDIMDDELSGDEEGLVLYYKFNQGVPGGDNTSITDLFCEVGDGENDAELLNFALSGETSNFNGTVEVGSQAISFNQIPNKLSTDAPFEVEATATSGLEVVFDVESGPATVEGNIVTLTGEGGEVTIKASQPGDDEYAPAEDVFNSFMVLDPATHVPDIEPRNPLTGDVYVPELGSIQLAAICNIEYPDLFSVLSVKFQIDTVSVTASEWGDGYYSAWWEPPAFGTYNLDIVATNNFGTPTTNTVTINIVQEVEDQEVLAVDDVWISLDNPSEIVTAELPSYMGAFDQITATLEVNCPTGGTGECGLYDYIASVEVKGYNGKWIEIIRYITPFKTECSSTIDLTDYMSLLVGKIDFRLSSGVFDNGYLYDLTLNYSTGIPAYNYSTIDVIWQETYPFGDMADLQPVEIINYTFPENTESATLKLVSTGHGWNEDYNTDNAAEFYEATHHIWVDGEQTFEQHNWNDCYPNPDDCQPQLGSYQHDRAGWCPGSIAPWFDFNMDEFVESETVELEYIFYEDYIDYCHPNNPDCVIDETCLDCEDGFNPHLVVACNLISFSSVPLDGAGVVGIEDLFVQDPLFSIYPNPTDGQLQVTLEDEFKFNSATLELFSPAGQPIQKIDWNGDNKTIDISSYPNGVYLLKVSTDRRVEIKKIILQ